MNFKKLILFTFGSLLLMAGILLFLNAPPLHMRDDSFLVEKGESLNHVAARLKGKKLISNELFFVYLAIIEGKQNVLIGNYKIYKGMTSRDIIKRFSKGDIIRRKVTIPEGFNLYEIADKLEDNKITDADDFLEYAFDTEFLRSIGINYLSAEGLLFPDTYVFAESQDARDILIIMHKHFKNIINSFDFSNMKKFKLDAYGIINLASLIEKEAQVPAEREFISAVFHNRLKRNITLGCDPSIRYAVKKFKDKIKYKDLKYDSPHNTYLHPGLPPTPICSPGKESITAALKPAKSDFLYFVSKNDGSHYFSKTLKEHNRAVDFYQKGMDNGFIDAQKL